MDYVTIARDGKVRELTGKIEVEAEDGGVLMLARDGVLWAVQPDEIQSRRKDDQPFERLSRDGIKEQLRQELPDGFQIHETAHYVIVYNTGRAYAEWVGGLFERLHRGFYNYWKKRGVKLQAAELPMIAMVFNDQGSYARYSRPELGEGADSIVGYYSLRSNRVITFDLTGRGELRTPKRPGSLALINKVLASPQAMPTVATIIHEATHQLAYNSGLQRRYAENPLWLSEGLAIYFETPDLKSSRGWRGIGSVSEVRLRRLRSGLSRHTYGDFLQLLTDDESLRGESAVMRYAQAWGWCHFLSRRYPKEFSAYISELSKLPALEEGTADDRIAAFRRHFGRDLEKLHGQFLRYVNTLR